VCPIDATARPPRLPSAKASTRIPRIARARADLGDPRCAENLRCAPPAGPLVDVPFHNELRLFIGEGPLLGDMDIGSSRTQKLLLRRCRDMAFRRTQGSVLAPFAEIGGAQSGASLHHNIGGVYDEVIDQYHKSLRPAWEIGDPCEEATMPRSRVLAAAALGLRCKIGIKLSAIRLPHALHGDPRL
jgi:hypothetical protein